MKFIVVDYDATNEGKRCVIIKSVLDVPRRALVLCPEELDTLEFRSDKWVLVNPEPATYVCYVDEHPEIIQQYNEVVHKLLVTG